VSFLSIIKAFNVLFVFTLGGIEFYKACLLSLLGRVIVIIPFSRVRLALFVRVIILELSKGIAFLF
jgi:hypothetical protein